MDAAEALGQIGTPEALKELRNINPDNNILTAVHTYVGLSQDAEVVIHIYDASGRIVRTLDVGFQSFGYYASRDKAAYWDGHNQSGELVSSGIYFYRLQVGDYSQTRKMVILK